MRKEVIEYAKTVTENTSLDEVVKVAESPEEIEYLLKASEGKRE